MQLRSVLDGVELGRDPGELLRQAIALVERIYKVTSSLPPEEMYG